MAKVTAQLAMSLDGFIADENDRCDELFGFYDGGDVPVKLSEGFPELHVSRTTADLLWSATEQTGATVVGRRLYDITNGWDGHPGGEVPMVVLTHNPPDDWPRDGVPIEFVAGAEAAVARHTSWPVAGTSRSPGARPPGRCWTPGCSTRSWSAWSR